MKKSDLIRAIAHRFRDLNLEDVHQSVESVLEAIGDSLANKDRVEIRNFGSFGVRKRKARIGRNPRTGERVVLPSTPAIFFKVGKKLCTAVIDLQENTQTQCNYVATPEGYDMKAMVYYGENDIRFEDREKPRILNPTDAVIRMTKTTICGTDLGIWKGKNPEIKSAAQQNNGSFDGRILGHEGVGIIDEVGIAVKNFKTGDKVIVSCISRCGTCENCQKQLYAHCLNEGGWILGYMIDGTQAEYVRTPFADTSLYLLPPELNEDVAVLLSDALPTAHEIGVQYGNVKPGDTIVIVGAGPVGMGCLLTAQLYSPSLIILVDIDPNRLSMGKELGATHTINSNLENAVERILAITDGRGVDCAMEAVGIEATWNICQQVVKEGGHLANVGVHGKSVNFALEKLWIKNLTITTGLVNANTTSMLLRSCCSGKLPIEKLVTHHFKFDELEKAYDVFKHAADEKAMKVIVEF